MQVNIYKSGEFVDISITGLSTEEGQQVQDVLNGFLFDTQQKDAILGIPSRKAQAIFNYIQCDGTRLPEGSPWSQKIADIKYVRSVTNCDLKAAKNWVDANIFYPVNG
jgi:hypothetical protein